MCGFLGAVDFDKRLEVIQPLLSKGLKAIAHRGPDSSKEQFFDNVYLGHNRLSIIDLSESGNQPMKSVNAEAYIIYNGEVYNYMELKNELKGTRFNSNSDSEVVMEGYLKEGTDFFKKLRGIYAFAIYDNRLTQKVILARDPAGVKPLYYFNKSGFHIFGSEIKALLPGVKDKVTINEDVIKTFLNLGYCPEPDTVYKEIIALAPGSVYEIQNGKTSKTGFKKYDFEYENSNDVNRNTSDTETHLQTAVKRNLTSDVEVAVALSGGIDSSLIYAYANKSDSDIKGLTVKFDDEEYNEEELSKVYSKTLEGKHEFVEVESELNLETLNKIIINFDQPYADSSAINVYYLTKATGKITKVLLGGDGGDELYNGYPSMTWLTYIERFNNNALLKRSGSAFLKAAEKILNINHKRSVKRIADLWKDDQSELLYDWHSWFPRKTLINGKSPFLFDATSGLNNYKKIFEDQMPHKFKGKVVFDYFRKQMLSDYLRKTDMMSMLNSVEYRVPLLDEDLTDLALSIPFDQKSSLKATKKILRDIHSRIYPADTSKAPKKGFTIPLDSSLSKEDFNLIKDSITSPGNFLSEYISKEYVKFLFDVLEKKVSADDEISRAGVYQRILMFYSLNLWYGSL
ncbi:MAG TPA: asparagine synthase (glutamine-hydrolyzing) [Ignavibacteria bacterium]|nr:asparagine synthase (glutamine-hydrolyzing) [Ignavibacteria bacterium]